MIYISRIAGSVNSHYKLIRTLYASIVLVTGPLLRKTCRLLPWQRPKIVANNANF